VTISSKLFELETSNLVRNFAYRMSTRCLNNFPAKGRGSGYVTPKIFSISSNISSELLKMETLNLAYSMSTRCLNNFPAKGRGSGYVTPNIFSISSNISSELLKIGTLNLAQRLTLGKANGRKNYFPQRGVS